MTAKTITSAANPVVKKLKSLSLKKHRDETGLFIVEGARHINDAIEKGWQIDTLAFSARAEKDPLFRNILSAADKRSMNVNDDLLSRITGRENTQSIIAAFEQKTTKLQDIAGGLWVVLEEIRDPGNLGTIIRTTHATGAEGIILMGKTCDAFSPECVRASMGSFAHIKTVTTTAEKFRTFRPTFPGKLIGTHLKGAIDYRWGNYSQPLIVVMGNEQSGLSEETAKLCDTLVRIPMPGGTESLNLAVATGLILFETFRNK